MKKILWLILLAIGASFLAAGQVALVSGIDGKVTLLRAGSSVPMEIGSLLDNGDELQTSAEAFAALKFLDGQASLRLFEKTYLRLSAENGKGGLKKIPSLSWGSLYARIEKGSGNFTCLTKNCTVATSESTFLVKVNDLADCTLIVLSGIAELTDPETKQAHSVEAGQTALLDHTGTFLKRDTRDTDFSKPERDFLNPQKKPVSTGLAVPLTDAQGHIRYVEFSW